MEDIGLFAVANGPGSFTGLRIGISAVKGLAFALSKPCAAVSTLEAMAYNVTAYDCVVCAAMDARCNQVYVAPVSYTHLDVYKRQEYNVTRKR